MTILPQCVLGFDSPWTDCAQGHQEAGQGEKGEGKGGGCGDYRIQEEEEGKEKGEEGGGSGREEVAEKKAEVAEKKRKKGTGTKQAKPESKSPSKRKRRILRSANKNGGGEGIEAKGTASDRPAPPSKRKSFKSPPSPAAEDAKDEPPEERDCFLNYICPKQASGCFK